MDVSCRSEERSSGRCSPSCCCGRMRSCRLTASSTSSGVTSRRRPPRSREVYVSQLRKALAQAGREPVIVTGPPGDVAELSRTARRRALRARARPARRARSAGNPEEAAKVLREALAPRRGSACRFLVLAVRPACDRAPRGAAARGARGARRVRSRPAPIRILSARWRRRWPSTRSGRGCGAS